MSGYALIGTFASLADACAAVGVEPPPGWANNGREFTYARCVEDAGKKRFAAEVARFTGPKVGATVINFRAGEMAIYREPPPGGEAERLSPAERLKREQENRRLAAKAVADCARIRKQHAEAAAKVAAQLVSASTPGTADRPHPYLVRKGLASFATDLLTISHRDASAILDKVVSPTGDAPQKLPWASPFLVVPLGSRGVVRTVQFIGTGGEKILLARGQKTGSYWLPKQDAGARVIGVAEGLATALSVTALFGQPCAVAIDAGNLLEAARSVLFDHPKARVLFFADNDTPKRHGGEVVNRGRTDALAAADSLPKARVYRSAMAPSGVLLPHFSAADVAVYRKTMKPEGSTPSDFNDALVIKRAKEVRMS